LKVAVFGGTFDPIHEAHLTVAREAARHFHLDQVLFVPASQPPHKRGATAASYEHRFRMVVLACQGERDFVASRLEEGAASSYSIHTIEKVKAGLGAGDRLFFLIGADAFAEIRTWYRWQEVIQAVEFIVMTRPGHQYEVPPGGKVHRLETLALPVSSSEIRARLAAGEEPSEVPPRVLGYVREQGLYR
jgi:nicotinate-nucleotide adenylyltransferase